MYRHRKRRNNIQIKETTGKKKQHKYDIQGEKKVSKRKDVQMLFKKRKKKKGL